jgi:hypothetical protein
MLQVRETHIERARFPAVDIHTHISVSAKSENGIELAPERKYLGHPAELLAVMDRKNVRAMVNLTGGFPSMTKHFPDASSPSPSLPTLSFLSPTIRAFKQRLSSKLIVREPEV